ncbi:ABC transporter substrate-binding protein [Corynebacterium mendelii]|uniref:ABC transporter substrate-binding protein n=1 Tax=Corynebacterium mendelii TaxID=2765362 RepID=A0A939E1T2_9CORY|nr:ABC transporter substrate-binding protein [Corynebacterium mendelii]MBN9645133.1 ABC transporter substrate-binding protein [Corynebacterium mendelii]
MTITNKRAAVAVAAALSLLVSACGKEDDTTATPATDTTTTTQVSSTGTTTPGQETTTEESGSAEPTTTMVAAGYPVTVKNCGVTVEVKEKPTHVVTLNQGATELVLALGAADQMAGTAYLDDEIDPSVKDAYDTIPVLSDKYPSQEKFLSVKPDLALASYNSAFGEKGVGSREELAALGINTYVDGFACQDKSQRATVSWDSIYGEVSQVGRLLGRDDQAATIVARGTNTLAEIEQARPAEGKTIFWYDSGGREESKAPFVGGNAGGPALIMEAVGATNIFSGIDGGWGDGSWETVLQANPDYIVLADASWDTAEEKKEFLTSNALTKDLDAVQNGRFIVVPFAESTPGVHLVDGAAKVADGVKK